MFNIVRSLKTIFRFKWNKINEKSYLPFSNNYIQIIQNFFKIINEEIEQDKNKYFKNFTILKLIIINIIVFEKKKSKNYYKNKI